MEIILPREARRYKRKKGLSNMSTWISMIHIQLAILYGMFNEGEPIDDSPAHAVFDHAKLCKVRR